MTTATNTPALKCPSCGEDLSFADAAGNALIQGQPRHGMSDGAISCPACGASHTPEQIVRINMDRIGELCKEQRPPILDEYYKPGGPGSYPNPFTPEAMEARDAELREKFASGQGVIVLQPNMPDFAILAVLKFALKSSNGKPFVVVPPSA